MVSFISVVKECEIACTAHQIFSALPVRYPVIHMVTVPIQKLSCHNFKMENTYEFGLKLLSS